MSDQEKSAGMKSYLSDNRCFMLLGSIFTCAVGCTIVFTAMHLLVKFLYVMGLQVAPSQELVAEMIIVIPLYTFIGIVLILYSISVHFISGGDDQ